NVSDGNGGFVTQRWVTELAKETIVTASDLPAGASDQDLWTAALGKTGTNRFRYAIGATNFGIGTVTVTFAPDAFNNVNVTTQSGTTPGARNKQIIVSFTVEGASARLSDPVLGCAIDINVLNYRNWFYVVLINSSGGS